MSRQLILFMTITHSKNKTLGIDVLKHRPVLLKEETNQPSKEEHHSLNYRNNRKIIFMDHL